MEIYVDETTWSNASYADMQGWLRGKKESKGGQHTIAVDARSRHMYAWTPRHKGFPKESPFTREVPMEVKRIVGISNPLVVGEKQDKGDKRRQIFLEKSCLGMDNHFSGEHVNAFLGENRYKTIHTTAHSRLGKYLKQNYHH